MYDLNGKLLHTFQYRQDGRVIELDSFVVLPNDEVSTITFTHLAPR